MGRHLLLAAALVVCVLADNFSISVVPANATLAAPRIEPLSVRAADPVPLAATPAPNPVAQAAPEVPVAVVNAAPAATPPPGPGGEQPPPAALPAALPAANPEVPVESETSVLTTYWSESTVSS